MTRTASVVVVAVCGLTIALAAQPTTAGARLRAGHVPDVPGTAVSGGSVFLDVEVTATGAVSAVTPVRGVEPFTGSAIAAVRSWEFQPAEDRGRAVSSHVLAAMVFRPPALYNTTGDTGPGDLTPAPSAIPFPIATATPAYPPLAHGPGAVLIEVIVDARGAVADAQVIQSAPPFDEPALAAARQWRFRPATVDGAAAARFAYLAFGFPAPVVVPPAPRSPGHQ